MNILSLVRILIIRIYRSHFNIKSKYKNSIWVAIYLTVSLFYPVQTFAQANEVQGSAFPDTHKLIIFKGDKNAQAIADKIKAKQVIEYGDRKVYILSENDAKSLSAKDRKALDKSNVQNHIFLRDRVLDTTKPIPTVKRGLSATQPDETQLYLIQFSGPVKDKWLSAVKALGEVKLISYIPTNAYLVYADSATAQNIKVQVSKGTYLQFVAPFHPEYKLHPTLNKASPSRSFAYEDIGADEIIVTVQFVNHPNVDGSINAVKSMAKEVRKEPWTVGAYRNIRLVINETDLSKIAKLNDVINIEPWLKPRVRGEIQGQILANQLNALGSQPTGPGYMAWLNGLGFNANFNFSVDVTDSGFDNGQITAANVHADFLDAGGNSRVAYVQRVTGTTISTTAANNLDTDGHGTLNAAIIGGLNTTPDTVPGTDFEDAAGYQYGLGIAPFVQIGASTILPAGAWTNPDFTELLNSAYQNGARISNNSWGSSCGGGCCPAGVLGAYNAASQEYDSLVRDARPATALDGGVAGNQEMTVVFSAGNNGGCPNEDLGNNGSTAKNTIVVGASENFNQASTDGCTTANAGANDARDIIAFSSRGPTTDGRIKPDIMAPGTHIYGAASQTAGFDGDGVCGAAANVPGNNVSSAADYFPAGQTLYTWSSGTSHSAPAVAGAAALVRQQFINQGQPAPSPAMIKAKLMNSTTWMTGTGANDTLPSNNQGMGRMNLADTFDNVPRFEVDQTRTFDSSGETFVINGTVSDITQPFRVTLAWTDAAGATVGNSWVNDLDLEVSIDDGTTVTLFRGNNFLNANSQSGGAADTRNNVESVWLPAGTNGDFTVTIRASNIAGDGVPNFGDVTDQDFALEVYNAALAPRTPVDLILLLDTSGSMKSIAAGGTAPKIEILRDAVELFIRTWTPYSVPGDNVSVVYFDSSISTFPVSGALQTLQGNEQNIIDAVRGEAAGGWTALGGGLQTAFNTLSISTNRRFVIMFSNGMQNFSPMVTSSGAGIHEIKAAATGAVVDGVTVRGDSGVADSAGTDIGDFGITVHTIGTGVSGAQWQDLIEDIATQTGGDHLFTSAPDADLQQFFIEDLVTSLRGTTVELIDYRHGTVSSNPKEKQTQRFTINSSVVRATFILSWRGERRQDALKLELHKVGSTIPIKGPGIKITKGEFYTLATVDFPLIVHGTPVAPEGDWEMRVSSNDINKSVPYNAAVLIDDTSVKYDFHLLRADYGIADPILLRAKITDAGIPVTDMKEAKVNVLLPKSGLGTFLSKNPVSKQDMDRDYGVDVDLFSTRVAKKEYILLQDPALRKQLAPNNINISLFDDGNANHGDELAGDGIYSAKFTQTTAPGHYHFDFQLTGNAPVSGLFTRQQSMATTVRMKGVDAAETLVTIEQRNSGFVVVVTPIDQYKNHLGPGYGHLIKIHVDKGELIGELQDNLDGTYQQKIRGDLGEQTQVVVDILDSVIEKRVEVDVPPKWWWLLILLVLVIFIIIMLQRRKN